MATYLELVNDAIDESGVDLDPLTSSTFASPPNKKMYERIKKWVNDAWLELCIDRDDWEFKVANATVFLYPAIYVEKFYSTNGGLPVASDPTKEFYEGATFVGEDSEVSLTSFKGVNLTEDAYSPSGWFDDDAAPFTMKGMLYFTELEAGYKLNEWFDETDPNTHNRTFQVKGHGYYNFEWVVENETYPQISDAREYLKDTFFISTTGGSDDQDNDASRQRTKLTYVPYSTWLDNFEERDDRGAPKYFTERPDGAFEFFPRPDKIYTLSLKYVTDTAELSAYDDEPAGLPSEYHPILYWAAVMNIGLFDKDREIFARAKKKYDFYMRKLVKNVLPDIGWASSSYNRE